MNTPIVPIEREAIAKSLRRNLDCYVAPHARIVGAVDLSHSAFADGRQDFVGTEFVAYRKRHVLDSAKCSRSERR
jgi:hypothetical protein